MTQRLQPAPAPDAPAIAPLSIVRMLWKQKLIILGGLLGLSAVTAAIVMRMPAVYKAEALVLVDSQKIPEKFVSSTVSSGVTDRLAAISQQIMSTTRLEKIIHDFDLYKELRKSKSQEEIVERMRQDISVNVQKDNWATGKPVAFKVGFEGPNPMVVAGVTNQLANLYIEENLQTRELEATGTSEFIDSQLNQAKQELDEQEQKVAKFKQEHNGSLPEQENPLLSNLSSLRVQLQGIQDGLNREQQNKLMLETTLGNEQATETNMERAIQVQTARGEAVTGDVGGVAAAPVNTRLQKAEQELEELKSMYTPEHPDVKMMEAEVARLREKEKKDNAAVAAAAPPRNGAAGSKETAAAQHAESQVTNPALLQQRAKIALLQSQLTALKRDMAFQESERQRIMQQIGANQARVDQLPLVEQQMAALTRDYDISKANYKSLLDKRIAAGMATDMERRQKSERFEIIDPARVPEKPFKPNRPLFLGGGIAVSLALSLVVAFGLEIRKGVLLGEWELPKDVVVLGRVPRIEAPGVAAFGRRGLGKIVAATSVAGSLAIAAVAFYWMRVRP